MARKSRASTHAEAKPKKGVAPEQPVSAAKTGAETAGEDLLSMEEAIELLKTTRPTFYRWLRSGKVKGMKVGRQWRFYREDIERFLKGEGPRIALAGDIGPLLRALEGKLAELKAPIPSVDSDNELEQATQLIFALGLAMRASDVHLQPSLGQVALLRMRIDGVLHTVVEFDARILPPLIERLKVELAADIHQKRMWQSGRGLVHLGKTPVDVRATFLPAELGESINMRLLRWDIQLKFEVERLGLLDRDLELLKRALRSPTGLVIASGPAGCGKTTTLYSCLRYVDSPAIKVATIEDPVEMVFPRWVQTNVRETDGLTFKSGVLALFRSDVDVMMIGEVRDPATMTMAAKGALAGHLILTSLHVPDAVRGLMRAYELLGADQAMAYPLLRDGLKVILSQRLVRALCAKCARPANPPDELLEEAEQLASIGGLDWSRVPDQFAEAVGCEHCGGTGYSGRVLIAETLEATPEIAAALQRGASADELLALSVEQGMTTMAARGVQLAAEGRTTLDEVFRVLR